MTIQLLRVVNEQILPQGISRDGSILLDKIDKSQGNSENPPYAQNPKQKLYVPWANPLDLSVKGYVDLVQTDEVLLQKQAEGSIGGLITDGWVTASVVASNLLATPVVATAVRDISDTETTVTGTTFLSVAPDLTYVELTNDVSGAVQLIPEANLTVLGTTITFLDAVVTIGTPDAGWLVRVLANSKFSNSVVLTEVA